MASACLRCKSKLPPAARFCPGCGAQVGEIEPADELVERRQITVVFIDLVGSTALAESVDVEDYQSAIAAFAGVVGEVVSQFGGTVAQYLGDGALIYFGYPQAREQDSRRACQVALKLVDRIGGLIVEAGGKRLQLTAKASVHTGTCVIGSVGTGSKRENLALGETTNLAARLLEVAEPGKVVISTTTHRLIQLYFEAATTGTYLLRGVSHPVEVYQLIGPIRRPTAQRFQRTPLVGRERDLDALLVLWETVRTGTGRVAAITGEAGIGKSRLIEAVRQELSPSDGWIHLKASPLESDTALGPVIDFLRRLAGLTGHADQDVERLESLLRDYELNSPTATALMARALGVNGPGARLPVLNLAPNAIRARSLMLVTSILLAAVDRNPTIMVIEDTHWLDSTTKQVVDALSRRSREARMLLLVAARSFKPAPSVVDLHIEIEPLPDKSARELVTWIGGDRLHARWIGEILDRAEGNPLYLEELTRNLLAQSGRDSRRGGSVDSAEIPDSLKELLLARVDQSSTDRRLIQVAAAIGHSFSWELLSAATPYSKEEVREHLQGAVDAGLLVQLRESPQLEFGFKHVLFRDAAYESMTRAAQRRAHDAIATYLRDADPPTLPEVMAHHAAKAGRWLEAVHYYNEAGKNALHAFANIEAVNHLERGLKVLAGRDGKEAAQAELELRTTLGVAWMFARGFASVEAGSNYQALLRRVTMVGEEGLPSLFPALWGMWTFYQVGGQISKAEETGVRLLELAGRLSDDGIWLAGHTGYGISRMVRGGLAEAQHHLESGLEIYDEAKHGTLGELFGQDPGAMCCSILTWIYAHQGNEEAGRLRAAQALGLAGRLGHHPTRCFVEAVVATFFCLLRDFAAGEKHARNAVKLAQRAEMLHWEAQGRANLGWALQGLGRFDEGIQDLERGLGMLGQTGTRVSTPYFKGGLIEACIKTGNFQRARTILDELFDYIAESDERFYVPELLCLEAELTLKQGGVTAPERVQALLAEAERLSFEQGAFAFAERAQQKLRSMTSATVQPVRG